MDNLDGVVVITINFLCFLSVIPEMVLLVKSVLLERCL